jgi:probable HAF family extracellular repeat protein
MFRHAKGMGRWLAIAVTIGLLCCSQALAKKPPTPPSGSGPAYTIMPFFPPDLESVRSQVTDLNELGHAVGFAELENSPAGYRAVHLDITTGVYTELQDGGYAGGVNNLNQIAGWILSGGHYVPAFWNDPSATPVELPLLPGDTYGFADMINDAGIITGYSNNENSQGGGVIWRVSVDVDGGLSVDGPLPLAPLPGDAEAWTVDLNELVDGSCQVAGTSNPGDGVYAAVFWTVDVNEDGVLTQPGLPLGVGSLGLLEPTYSQASGINDLGDVCGLSDKVPFVALAGETAQPLPVPRNTQWGNATDINNFGEIVGQLDIYKTKGFIDGPGNFHAYLWKNGEMIDLETQIDLESGWDRLWAAHVINDAGVIAGRGRFDVESRGFLLIPNGE